MEQQIEADCRAEHFGQVASDNGQLAQDPEDIANSPRIFVAAGLRQVTTGDDAEPRAERLEQKGHQVRQHEHPEQAITETRPALQIGGPIARIHVPDAHQVGGARQRLIGASRSECLRWQRSHGLRGGSILLGRWERYVA